MAITQNMYTGDGATVLFSFTFPYLETTDIKVSLNGTVTTAYTLANATTVQFTTAPASGTAVRIYRDTNVDQLSATFYPGSAIRANDLNNNFLQSSYSAQEVLTRTLDPFNAVFTGNISLSGYKVTSLAPGTAPTDAVNKAQLDASVGGYIASATASAQAAATSATQSQQSATAAASASTSASTSAAASSSAASSAITSANAAANFAGKTVFLGFTRNINGTLSLTWSSPAENTTYSTDSFEYKNGSQWFFGSNDLLHTSGALLGQPKVSFNNSGHLIISV